MEPSDALSIANAIGSGNFVKKLYILSTYAKSQMLKSNWTILVGPLADDLYVKRYFWTDANYSAIVDDFIIYDGAVQLFSNYTIDNNITKKVPIL